MYIRLLILLLPFLAFDRALGSAEPVTICNANHALSNNAFMVAKNESTLEYYEAINPLVAKKPDNQMLDNAQAESKYSALEVGEIDAETLEQAIDNQDAENGWFSTTEQPAILLKREKKTKFNKHDKYYGKNLCDNGMYTCIALKKSDTWQTLFPDRYQRELVQRINRTNQGLWNRNWILVPNDINRDYMDFSPLPEKFYNDNSKTILIDLSELAFGAYDQDGDLLYWGPVNPGQQASQTVQGNNFQIYRKGGADCWSKKFESKIPYCMFFHGGYAIHGFSMPGYAASHGCVRVYTDDALWLNKNFADYKTKVIVQP